jgi:RNA polymerase sigma-70 factor (ECF subfamily)
MDKVRFMQGCAQGGAALNRMLQDVQTAFGKRLLWEAQQALRDLGAIQDVLQETLIKAWRYCGDFRGESEVFSWLRTILQRTIVDHLRKTRPEVPLQDDANQVHEEVELALIAAANSQAHDPLAVASSGDAQRLFDAGFDQLRAESPLAAMVMLWVARDQLSMEELAALLDRTPGATREYVSQCRKKARVYLAPWYRLVRDAEGTGP